MPDFSANSEFQGIPVSFSINSTKAEGVTVISIKGYLTLEGGKELRSKVTALVKSGEKLMVLDFSGAPLISSAALGQMIEFVAEAVPNSTLKLAFCGLSETNQFSFQTIGLLEHVEAFPILSAAIEHVKY